VHDTTDQFYIGVNEATAALMQSYLGWNEKLILIVF
jgi:hypothetical protein